MDQSKLTWQDGCAMVGWAVIALVTALGVLEVAILILKWPMHQELNIKVVEMDEIIRSNELLATVRRLSLGGYSGMNVALNAFIRDMLLRSIDAKAILMYNGEEAVGWALYSRDVATDHWRFNANDGSICFQVYVNPTYRRMGIGSRLMKAAISLSKGAVIKVYESDAPAFFALHKDQAENLQNIYG